MAKKTPPKSAKKSKPASASKPKKARAAAKPPAKPKPVKAKPARAPSSERRSPAKASSKPVKLVKATKPAPARPAAASRPRSGAAKLTKPEKLSLVVDDELDDAPDEPVVAEPPLTAAEIEEFRSVLVQKRAQLLGDMTTLQNEALNKNRRDAAGDLSSMPIHMADLGTDNYEMEFTLGLIEGERQTLREIDEALDRIKKGTYGVCVATGKPIGKARLKAQPWARFCYEYTLQQEKTGQLRRL